MPRSASDDEHDASKLKHFERLGRATVVLTPGSLGARRPGAGGPGGAGGRLGTLRQKTPSSSSIMTSSPTAPLTFPVSAPASLKQPNNPTHSQSNHSIYSFTSTTQGSERLPIDRSGRNASDESSLLSQNDSYDSVSSTRHGTGPYLVTNYPLYNDSTDSTNNGMTTKELHGRSTHDLSINLQSVSSDYGMSKDGTIPAPSTTSTNGSAAYISSVTSSAGGRSKGGNSGSIDPETSELSIDLNDIDDDDERIDFFRKKATQQQQQQQTHSHQKGRRSTGAGNRLLNRSSSLDSMDYSDRSTPPSTPSYLSSPATNSSSTPNTQFFMGSASPTSNKSQTIARKPSVITPTPSSSSSSSTTSTAPSTLRAQQQVGGLRTVSGEEVVFGNMTGSGKSPGTTGVGSSAISTPTSTPAITPQMTPSTPSTGPITTPFAVGKGGNSTTMAITPNAVPSHTIVLPSTTITTRNLGNDITTSSPILLNMTLPMTANGTPIPVTSPYPTTPLPATPLQQHHQQHQYPATTPGTSHSPIIPLTPSSINTTTSGSSPSTNSSSPPTASPLISSPPNTSPIITSPTITSPASPTTALTASTTNTTPELKRLHSRAVLSRTSSSSSSSSSTTTGSPTSTTGNSNGSTKVMSSPRMMQRSQSMIVGTTGNTAGNNTGNNSGSTSSKSSTNTVTGKGSPTAVAISSRRGSTGTTVTTNTTTGNTNTTTSMSTASGKRGSVGPGGNTGIPQRTGSVVASGNKREGLLIRTSSAQNVLPTSSIPVTTNSNTNSTVEGVIGGGGLRSPSPKVSQIPIRSPSPRIVSGDSRDNKGFFRGPLPPTPTTTTTTITTDTDGIDGNTTTHTNTNTVTNTNTNTNTDIPFQSTTTLPTDSSLAPTVTIPTATIATPLDISPPPPVPATTVIPLPTSPTSPDSTPQSTPARRKSSRVEEVIAQLGLNKSPKTAAGAGGGTGVGRAGSGDDSSVGSCGSTSSNTGNKTVPSRRFSTGLSSHSYTPSASPYTPTPAPTPGPHTPADTPSSTSASASAYERRSKVSGIWNPNGSGNTTGSGAGTGSTYQQSTPQSLSKPKINPLAQSPHQSAVKNHIILRSLSPASSGNGNGNGGNGTTTSSAEEVGESTGSSSHRAGFDAIRSKFAQAANHNRGNSFNATSNGNGSTVPVWAKHGTSGATPSTSTTNNVRVSSTSGEEVGSNGNGGDGNGNGVLVEDGYQEDLVEVKWEEQYQSPDIRN